MSSDKLQRRTTERPFLMPFEINTLMADVQSTQHPDAWQGNAGGSGNSFKPETEDNWPIWVKLTRNIPEYGVFYAKTGWGAERLHASGVDELTSTNLAYDLFLTTPAGGVAGVSINAYIIGTHQPHRVLFDDTNGIPLFGDTVGVLPGSYKVSLGFTGMLAVSDGDSETGTVWVIRNDESFGKGVRLLQLTEVLYPGSIAGANLIIQIDGVWSIAGACLLQDVQHRSFGLAGDLIWAVRTGVTSDGLTVYDAVGENGLEQIGLTAEAIECDGVGSFTVRHGNLTKDVTDQALSISDKTGAVYGAARVGLVDPGSCDFNTSSASIDACADPGFSRKIFAGEKVRLRYSTANRRWIYHPVPELLFCNAQLTSDMCNTNDKLGDITELVGNICKNDVIIPADQTFSNPYNLRCKAGDDVYAQFDGLLKWRIIQVLHIDETIVLESYWDPDTCAHKTVSQETVIQRCVDKGAPVGDPIGTEIDIVSDIQHNEGSGENCDTAYPVYRSIRALCPGYPSVGTVPIVEWGQAAFMIDVYDDGTDIIGCWMTVNVPTCGRSTDCEPIMEVDPCTSGSGSGA